MSELSFTVDSALLSELGEKLVESVHVALVELVKNAYDADATKVTVHIKPLKSGGSQVIIEDNGSGMALKDVKAYWMHIGTSHKKDENVSELYGRPRTGSKGIGRFSCRRLGTSLHLRTVAETSRNSFEVTECTFDWAKFKPGTDVSDIKCPGSTKHSSSALRGTTLTIESRDKDEWNLRGYDFLRRHLALLVANRGTKRSGFKEDPGFEIILDCPGFSDSFEDLRESLFNAGWGTMEGAVDNHGAAKITLVAKDISKREITYPDTLPKLRGTTFKIGIVVFRKQHLRDPKILSNEIIRDLVPEWGGIQIRQNGFRVYPYGDDDWLNIDLDRSRRLAKVPQSLQRVAAKLTGVDEARALLSLLSMRNYIGAVDIGNHAEGFEPKASREGFLQSESFRELREFVRFAVDWSTVYRDYYIRSSVAKTAEEAKEKLQEVVGEPLSSENIVQAAAKYIKDETRTIMDALPPQQRKSIKKTIDTAISAIIKRDSTTREELQHLRLIASTSTLLLIFSHEVKFLLGLLSDNSGYLSMLESKVKGNDKKHIREMQNLLDDTRMRFSQLLAMTSAIGNVDRSAKPIRIAIKDQLAKTIECFNLIITRHKINIDISDVESNVLVGPILDAELSSVLLNLISNSIKSVIASGQKQISISAKKRDGHTHLIIRDQGIGLPSKHFQDVFIPFYADPERRLYKALKQRLGAEDQYIIGSGSGLGLSIVKEIINSRNGSIAFVKPTQGWEAELEVIFP